METLLRKTVCKDSSADPISPYFAPSLHIPNFKNLRKGVNNCICKLDSTTYEAQNKINSEGRDYYRVKEPMIATELI